MTCQNWRDAGMCSGRTIFPTTKGEKTAAHRTGTDENELRLATHIVAILRRMEQFEKKSSAQFAELLLRAEDTNKSTACASSSSVSSVNPAVVADVEFLKDMVMEGRTAITNLTAAVNVLVDLPTDLAGLSRTVQAMARADTSATATQNVVYENPRGVVNTPVVNTSQATGPFAGFQDPAEHIATPSSSANGIKRPGAFAGFDDPTENKRHKTYAEELSHTDVYLWNVNVDAAAPMAIAMRALSELRMDEFSSNVISVARPRNTPKTLISIRFCAVAIADEFVDRLRSNPPASMAKLQAAKKDSYEKKGKAPCLRIMAWNIHGRLAVKIHEPDIVRLIEDNDVVIFQETFLRIGEERTLSLPPGFEIVAMSCRDRPGLKCAGGGVAAVIRVGTPYKLLSHLCAPDLIALDLVHLTLVGAYILPEASNWSEWTDVDPKNRVAEAVTALATLPDKPLMFHSDTNCCTGNRIPTGAILARASCDTNNEGVCGKGSVHVLSTAWIVGYRLLSGVGGPDPQNCGRGPTHCQITGLV
ncbi:hypothetical protein C8R45DRAFT_1117018 [Mycena sanguinolenta]|nr:hypothetical protein C8R45DRAFT_1117018 [Mycena sanguinolenta]